MIPLAKPKLSGNELKYVTDAISAGEIANGPYIEAFETAFAAYVGAKYAVSCSSGTAGLHLALLAAGVGWGDEVIVPALTYVATANAVKYCGAAPKFVDIDPVFWGLSRYTDWKPFTEVVIATHLYGRVSGVPKTSGPVIVDACEALGADLTGKLGDLAVFSFYGNKVITTGEGGMVVTDSPWYAKQLRFYRGQAQAFGERYWHTEVGYNYRMSNVTAAIGLGQLEGIDGQLARRREIIEYYANAFEQDAKMAFLAKASTRMDFVRPDAPWLFTFTVDPTGPSRDEVMARLTAQGVETRPTFVPLPRLPMYRDGKSYPNAEFVGDYGLSIPTHCHLTDDDLRCIVSAVYTALR